LEVKRRALLIVIALDLAALAALTFIYPHLMVSPGPLIKAHADLTTDCFDCHAPLRGPSSSRCIACHVPVDIGLRTTKGVPIGGERTLKASFHQELIEHDCMACHIGHLGSTLAQHSRMAFSHALLREPVREQCASCHVPPKDAVHRSITASCGQCHKTAGWKPATFDHDKFFLLDRDHNVGCGTCHTSNDFSRYTCYTCHEHRPEKIRSKHIKEGIRNFENCVECHRSAEEDPEHGESRGRRERD
jgi:hypothetical protein